MLPFCSECSFLGKIDIKRLFPWCLSVFGVRPDQDKRASPDTRRVLVFFFIGSRKS